MSIDNSDEIKQLNHRNALFLLEESLEDGILKRGLPKSYAIWLKSEGLIEKRFLCIPEKNMKGGRYYIISELGVKELGNKIQQPKSVLEGMYIYVMSVLPDTRSNIKTKLAIKFKLSTINAEYYTHTIMKQYPDVKKGIIKPTYKKDIIKPKRERIITPKIHPEPKIKEVKTPKIKLPKPEKIVKVKVPKVKSLKPEKTTKVKVPKVKPPDKRLINRNAKIKFLIEHTPNNINNIVPVFSEQFKLTYIYSNMCIIYLMKKYPDIKGITIEKLKENNSKKRNERIEYILQQKPDTIKNLTLMFVERFGIKTISANDYIKKLRKRNPELCSIIIVNREYPEDIQKKEERIKFLMKNKDTTIQKFAKVFNLKPSYAKVALRKLKRDVKMIVSNT